MINYCSSTSQDLVMRYLYPKADIQTAQRDHDYLIRPFGEDWVDQALQTKLLKLWKKRQEANPVIKKWFHERQWRITASRFGEICKITERRNIKKLCESLVNPKPINTPSIHHGKMYEAKALNQFQEKFKMKTTKCGLFVSPEKPFLGASPDALVGNDSVVEVKCPYTGRNEKIEPGVNFKFLANNDDGSIVLKKTSPYYDQIQGQLYLSKRKTCYFIVYTLTDLFVQEIKIDNEYCTGCLIPKLELFYTKHFRPYVASIL